jgi:LPS export ABC transporter protein LptC
LKTESRSKAENMVTVKNTLFLLFALFIFFTGCTFDYGEASEENEDQPDIVMSDVEYVRIRDGDPVVRFRAQEAERYEKKQTMELRNFSFEQFENHGNGVNASGSAGSAHVDLDSGNILLENGIIIAVDSEDITLRTSTLSWQDEEHILSGEDSGIVDITRSDGTTFYGKGFTADTRSRTWEFTGGIDGTFVDEDDDDEEPEAESEDIDSQAADLEAGLVTLPGELPVEEPLPEDNAVPEIEADPSVPEYAAEGLW